MNNSEHTANSIPTQYRMVFHNAVNDHETLFGGILMQWMDEVAYITASRYTRMRMVTVEVESVRFFQAVRAGMVLEFQAGIAKTSAIKLWVKLEVFAGNLTTAERTLCAEAAFVFAAVNDELKPVRLQKTTG